MEELVLNQDQDARDAIIFDGAQTISKYYMNGYSGGVRRFDGINVIQLESLFKSKFIDPQDAQNDAPTCQEFYDFMLKWKKHPIMAHGYVVEKKRSDYRVSIEGLAYNNDNEDIPTGLLLEFTELCRLADSFKADVKNLYCWFD